MLTGETKCQTGCDFAVDRRKGHAGKIKRNESIDTCCKNLYKEITEKQAVLILTE
jgi:hypothetical protein